MKNSIVWLLIVLVIAGVAIYGINTYSAAQREAGLQQALDRNERTYETQMKLIPKPSYP